MMSSDQLNRESESHGYARPAMIGVGLVGPVPEQMHIKRDARVLCSKIVVGSLGLHGLGCRGSHQEQCPVASVVHLHSDDKHPCIC